MADRVTILAADPGKTTGIARVTVQAGVIVHVELAQETNPHAFVDRLQYLRDVTILEVVIENFVGGGMRNADSSLTERFVGYYSLTAEHLGYRVTLQEPSFRKHRLAQAKELAQVWDPQGTQPHAVDALAHALAYARKEGIVNG